jgi:signal transduction histidine kinase
MLEEAQRLQLLTQRLLELASAEGDAPTVHRTRMRLDEQVRVWVSEWAILAENKNQRLVVTTAECVVHTDEILLRQALQNLVDNAIKYSPKDTTINVLVRVERGSARIEVADQGPGIGEEYRTQLMARFFRPDSGRGREQGGFGLGLALTKAYLRMLGGVVQHEPAPGGGSVFRLTLPVEQGAPERR